MHTQLMLDPAVAALFGLALALLFAVAASHKLRDLPQFEAAVDGYRLLPLRRWRLAWVVPVLEALIAGGLLAPATRDAAAAAGMLLLGSYAGAMAINLRAGRTAIACGCGGRGQAQPIAPWMVWRNGLLSLVLGACLLPRRPRPLELTDAVTIGLGLAALALLYLSAEQLLAQPQQPSSSGQHAA